MGLCSNHWSEITQGNPNWRYVQDIEEKETDALKKKKFKHTHPLNPLEYLPGSPWMLLLYFVSAIWNSYGKLH